MNVIELQFIRETSTHISFTATSEQKMCRRLSFITQRFWALIWFKPLLMRPRGVKMARNTQGSIPCFFFANIKPKLNKLWKTSKIYKNSEKKDWFLVIFQILFNSSWILAQKHTMGLILGSPWSFWHPWHPCPGGVLWRYKSFNICFEWRHLDDF